MFKVFRFAALVATIVLISGCATPPPKDALLWQGAALAAQVARTRQSFPSVNLEAVRPSSSAKITETADYRQERSIWCRDEQRGDEWALTRSAFGELCRRQGGNFESDFCIDGEDRQRVLFMAKVTRPNGFCPLVEIVVLSPKGPFNNDAYVARLRQEGLKSDSEIKLLRASELQQRQAAAARRDQERATEARRLAIELPQKQRRGASICRQEGYVTFVAHVEDFTEDKLRVLVSSAYLTHTPSMSPGGFQQHIEWVNPADWYPCEFRPNR